MENIAPLRLAEKWDNVSAFPSTQFFDVHVVKGRTITRYVYRWIRSQISDERHQNPAPTV